MSGRAVRILPLPLVPQATDALFTLAVTLTAHLPGVDKETAEQLVKETHEVCPYSNATRGNIEVTLATTV